jgi:predicted ATPase
LALSAKTALSLEQQVLNGRFPDYLWQVSIRRLRGFPTSEPLTITFPFPVTAIAGENGAGKSTVLAAVYLAYKHIQPAGIHIPKPGEMFPRTAYDDLPNAEIRYRYITRDPGREPKLAYPEDRWSRDLRSFPQKSVAFFRLSRIVPQSEATGLLSFRRAIQASDRRDPLPPEVVTEVGRILGRTYRQLDRVVSKAAPRLELFVALDASGRTYSSLHMGAGEEAVIRLVYAFSRLPNGSLVVVDKVENSLHPAAQRRLIEYFVQGAAQRQIQTVISTHSATVLDALPASARWFLRRDSRGVEAYHRVAVEFAQRQLDPAAPGIPVYVEDQVAATWLTELLHQGLQAGASRFAVIVAGGADLIARLVKHRVQAEGPRACLAVLDGDQAGRYDTPNTYCLPGRQAPELELLAPLTRQDPGRPSAVAQLADQLHRSAADVERAVDAVLAGYDSGYYDHHALLPLLAQHLGLEEPVVRHAVVTLWLSEGARRAQATDLLQQLAAF